MRTLLLFFLLAGSSAPAQVTFSTGSPTTWTIPTLSSTITSAGKNYEHVETSGTAQTLLKVNALALWTVYVQQTTTSNWDSSLKLWVRRTGDGTGSALLGGGLSYIQVSTTSQSFFSGLLNLGFSRDAIPIQYKIEGLSVTLPVKTYTTTIQYTISGL